jgi:hypothetical protein
MLSNGSNRDGGSAAPQEASRFMAVETTSKPGPALASALLPAPVIELAARPGAAFWARECAWVPGTGLCRRRPCSTACVFHHQRSAEAERVSGARRIRRPSQRPGAYRPEPARAALLVLRRLLSRVLG